jgi:hypothetical protein
MMAACRPDVIAGDLSDATTARRCQEPSRLVGSEELRGLKAKGCA